MLTRLLFFVAAVCLSQLPVLGFNFSISQLQGVTLTASTSLQFGPDHRLYVSQVDGSIKALTIQRLGPNNYQVTATETIDLVKNIPNYDDSGTRNFTLTKRQVTALLVVGTAESPVLYVTSSDPRIGGGSGGENDLNLDTNSGIISRLTRVAGVWNKVDLVRGLPRSEENHASNGMQLDLATNTLYVAQGGNTNAGGPSINFAYMGETALSAAILSVNLNALDAMPVKTDQYGQKYVYDIPTVDDPNPSRAHNPDGTDHHDPFGGNDGLNQAKLVPGGPVQVYSSGWRNPYDLVVTRTPGREGRMYSFDNGANVGWGGYPKNEGSSGTVTNEYLEGEPGTVNDRDGLYHVTPGFYRGHPNPLRANPSGAGWFHFEADQPVGSQKIFSLSPTSDWPAVPVSMANPVEGDFRLPGVADNALLTYTESTNGLTEYVATNFGGAMQGNLIAATYDGKLLRIQLNADGTAVTNGVEFLATGFGNLPLDVTAPDPGHGAAFVGTLWVVHYSPAKISILEPEDFDSPGGSSCTGINSFDVDEDGDGFSNADEIANNSDPCSGAIRPPDVDGDHVSDKTDTDDDNDGIPDLQDRFPIDPLNSQNVAAPARYDLFNESGVGFYGVGFTGVMMNPAQDYLQRRSPDNVIAGGTAGLFTVAQSGAGTPRGSTNSQKDAYHFGILSNEFTAPYIVRSRLAGPFFSSSPTGSQRQGVYVGTGDQDNYISVALHANNGAGGVEVVHEANGIIVAEAIHPIGDVNASSTIDLLFEIDPLAGTVQPLYQLDGASAAVPMGPPISVTGKLLMAVMGPDPLAIGLFTNRGSGDPAFPATWDFFDVASLPSTAIAKIIVDPSGSNMVTASTYNAGSFRIENHSTGGQHIEHVYIDISTSILPDVVFDTTGAAGDPVAKNFTPNSASTGVVLTSGAAVDPHNGTNSDDGFDAVEMDFSSFPVNGAFTFSIDIDPNNVKGVAQPGEHDAASVSGLELAGSIATVYFSDGSVHRTRLGRIEGSVDGSYGWARADQPPQPTIGIAGSSSPFTTNQAPQTVRVSGPAGLSVSLVVVESGLYLGGVPGGGYNVQPYDTNTAIKVTEYNAAIGEIGYVDVPITLTQTETKAGYNLITATLADTNGIKGAASDTIVARYDPSFTGGDDQPPSEPGNLAASSVGSKSVSLSWSASTDNVGVVAYDISRNGTLLTTVFGLTYTDIGLDPGTGLNYSVVARDQAGNISVPATVSTTTLSIGTVVSRINAGGPAFVDSFGKTWAADTGFNTGTTSTTTQAINRTVDDTIFKSRRLDSQATAPDLIYSLNLPNGEYDVQFLFSENDTGNSAVGKRVFDVSLEGAVVLDNFDIFASAGAPYTAVSASAITTVSDGQLNIHFGRVAGNPQINAIKVIQLPPSEMTPPSSPPNLQVTNVTSNSVTLEWQASTDNVGVTAYSITRNGVLVQTVSGLTFSDGGLNPSTSYDYEVRARDAAGNESAPSTISATTLEPPPGDTQPPTAPGTPTFTDVTSSSLTVQWSAATDNVAVATYRVSRNGTLVGTVNALSFADTGLSANTNYTYAIVAVDAANNASPPASAAITTLGGSTPSAVRINTGGGTYVDPSGNTWSADTGYNTGTAKLWDSSLTVTGTSNPVLFRSERYDSPTSPNLTYSINIPNGNYVVRLHLAETYGPTSGAGLRVFDVDIQGVRAFDDIDIFTAAGGANKAIALEKSVSVTNGKVTITFLHQVQNPKVNAIEIVPVTTTPTDTQAPTQPGPITFSGATTSSLTLSWTASTDNVGVTGYRISRNGSVVTTVTGLTFTDTGLAANTSYNYSIVALDAANNASAQRTGSGATLDDTPPADTQPPTQPGPITFSGATTSSLTLSWTASTDNVGVTGYRISRNGSVVTTVSDLTFTDTGLAADTSYNYSIVAIDAANNVSVERTGSGATLADTPPADTQPPTQPGPITFSGATTSSLTLSWTASTDNVGVTGYRISRNGSVVATVTGLTFTDTGLAANTSYNYSIVALDAANNASVERTGSSATLADTPPPGTAIRVNAGGPAYIDSAGNTWSADFGYNTGKPSTDAATVTGTTDPQLFKTLRFDEAPLPNLVYAFSVPNGSYRVRLHMAETSGANKAPGKRIFDIDIQDERVFENVDIFVLAGGGNKALVLEHEAQVANGQISIRFVHQVNVSRVHAIEILPLGGAPAPSDTQAPTQPGSPTFSNVTSSSVTLSWTGSTDNVGVTGYEVRRNGTLVTTITGLTFTDTGLSASTSYTYSITARDAAGNSSPASSATVATTSGSSSLPSIRVNAGGGAYTDTQGRTWSADFGYNTGVAKAWSSTLTVTGTTYQTLFRSERYDPSAAPEMSYTFNLPNGSYIVRLYMAETYTNTQGPGRRIFDVNLQGVRRFEDVDIFTLAGGSNKVLVLESPETVASGQLKIDFFHQVENPKVNAIEIVPATP